MRHRRNTPKYSAPWLFLALLFVHVSHAQAVILNGIDVKAKAIPLTAEALQKTGLGDQSTLVLVQFSGPIQPEWLDGLRATGATVHHYIADFAYLVTMKPNTFDSVKSAGNVSWVGTIPDAAKVNIALAAKIAKARQQKSEETSIQAIVLSYGELAAKTLEAKGHRIRSDRETIMGWNETRVTLPLSKVSDAAAINSVFTIEEDVIPILGGERAAQTAAGQYQPGATTPFGPGYTAWLGAEGLSGGTGITVHLFDDGIDKGIATNLPGTAHTDILGRIVGIFNATNDADGASRGGHGHLDAAIIMGNATAGTTDSTV